MTAPASTAVIEFPQARVRPAAPREPGAASAVVVIFSGVRVERLPEEPQSMPKAPGGIRGKRRGQRR